MIYFFADDHFSVHPGKNIFEHLPEEWKKKISFYENDFSVLESGKWLSDCQVLVLNMIGGTCNIPHPGSGAEKAVRQWCEKGGNILLLHGSSAAFWMWDYWRKLPGIRWVRPNDPDGAKPSTHPVKPYKVTVCKSRHPLCAKLSEMDLPEDEIYTELEYTSSVFPLMETRIGEGTFIQCCETLSPWGGKIINFLPGHKESVTANTILIQNLIILMQYLSEVEKNEKI